MSVVSHTRLRLVNMGCEYTKEQLSMIKEKNAFLLLLAFINLYYPKCQRTLDDTDRAWQRLFDAEREVFGRQVTCVTN